jgi:predicted nucleic acid-binding protein
MAQLHPYVNGIAAKADYLVTGDRKHLLELGAYQDIQIATPRQLLDVLSSTSPPG